MIEFLLSCLVVVQAARFVVEIVLMRGSLADSEEQTRLLRQASKQQEAAFKEQAVAYAQAERARKDKVVYKHREDGVLESVREPEPEN